MNFGHDCEPEHYTDIDPIRLLGMWLGPDTLDAPPLMALATTGTDGYPRVRHVLLTEVAGGRLHFHTDSASRKVRELAESPRASCALVWPDAGRQMMVTGDVVAADAGENARAYRTRSRYLQLLAWLNTEEMAAMPVEDRHAAWAAFDREHPALDEPRTWAGYAIEPREIVFWRGDSDGPSRRVRFTRGDGTAQEAWRSELLPG
ncbi:pyridoxine 5'-phosphate oxidase [Rhodococcus rhodnii]|uniref:Pyridoxamine 5'-phosphate oxidase n=2 Tax=Rhodococcus rhodnii TaxID=38312 RepID=R7WN87_9NOCA|nr:pyridoxamine 5'-phosphate oxidase family protein [Rhodococcus rhodnii]EOM76781.1 pyridoxamine 5'-phosphate oxidase [Rhodococcus rhodnii LMG 5362]TXG90040.1 pyridoxine 5'-phosphate oxidase [Rhodococcus rhodnii]